MAHLKCNFHKPNESYAFYFNLVSFEREKISERMNRLPLIYPGWHHHRIQIMHTVFKAYNKNKTDYENANVLANGKQQQLP